MFKSKYLTPLQSISFFFLLTVSFNIVLVKPEDLEIWFDKFSFCSLTMISTVRHILKFVLGSFCELRRLYEISNTFRQHLISNTCILFSNSAIEVHDLQACRKYEYTRDCISVVLVQEICSYLFKLAAVVFAFIEGESGKNGSNIKGHYRSQRLSFYLLHLLIAGLLNNKDISLFSYT